MTAGERLREERAAVVAGMAVRAAELSSAREGGMTEGRDDEHDPDGATAAFEHALATGLAERAAQRLTEIDLAISNLEAGTYGHCERCGDTISAERLAALPAAGACAGCAARRPPLPGGRSMGRGRPDPAGGGLR